MGRPNRFTVMEKNKDIVIQYISALNKHIFTFDNVNSLLTDLKENNILLKSTKLSDFFTFLRDNQIVTSIDIKLPKRGTTRYLFESPSVFEVALSLNKKAYLSHYTAIFLHHLTDHVPKKIYINAEQAEKYFYYDEDEILQQKNIDLAFSRPMRETNQIASFELNNQKYEIYMLNGKNQKRIGVIDLEIEGKIIPVAGIERTLIDAVVRPGYAGGVHEVLIAFEEARGKFSVNKMLSMLKKMNFRYPYHQLIGFYLERSGYQEKVLKLLDQFAIEHDFYLTYQMRDKNYSSRWKVFYPKELDE